MNRDEFALAVDSHGMLRPDSDVAHVFDHERGALPHFLVFSQNRTPRLDIGGWRSRARSFFDADVGLAVDKDAALQGPEVDAALVMIHAGSSSDVNDVSRTAGTRLVLTRPTAPPDVELARTLEAASNAYGLAPLAERCPRVWLIGAEGNDDRSALLLAAVIASFELGPIIDPAHSELMGVRTARARHDRLKSAYR